MSRPLRIDVEEGWYHVTARGINRQSIFGDDRDRLHFLELLALLPERFRVVIHAYVCMSNYHLILQTPDANLSQAMQWLNVSYSAWYNARYDRTGCLFQGRFKSVLIEGVGWACELSVYVHLNPLRIKGFGLSKRDRAGARLGQGKAASDDVLKKRLQRLRTYRWSSYRAYAGYVEVPDWLETQTILKVAARRQKDFVAAYRKSVRVRLVEGADPDRLDALRERIAIGSAAFVAATKKGVGKIRRETSLKRELRPKVEFGDVVHSFESVTGESWTDVLNRHGDVRKWLVLSLARRTTQMTLAELGVAAGAKDYAAVGMGLRRFDKQLKTRKDLVDLSGRMEQMLYVET